MLPKIEENLNILRKAKPLILCLTNYVTMNPVANCLLSVGASPIMSESVDEIEELVKASKAVYINIGTLSRDFMHRALFACKMANRHNKPVILDPVGAGVSEARNNAIKELLLFVDIIRGNASEILAVCGKKHHILGVESADKTKDAMDAAIELALSYNITVIVTGEEDFITDGTREISFKYGSKLMSLVTGMGCRLSAVITAFRSVNPDSFDAICNSALYFTLAGQIAETITKSPAAFEDIFMDLIYNPDLVKMKFYLDKQKVMELN